MKSEWVVTDCFWVIAPHTELDPPGPLHRIWPKTKLIAEDGDVKDGAGWAHCRAAWLTLGVMFVCVNVCACRFDHELSVWRGGVRAQTSQRLTSNSASCACGLSFFVVSEEGGALVFASLALKAETTPSCDCFAKHKRYFCPFSVADCL